MTKEGKSSEQEIRKQPQEVSGLEKTLEQQKKAADDSNTKLAEAEQSADHCAESIDEFGETIAEKGLDELGEVVDAAKETAEFVIDVGSSFEAAMSEKAKELGATTKFMATEVAEAV